MLSLRKVDKMEIWDAYDEEFNKIKDKELIRGEKISVGLYHLVCENFGKAY